MTTPRVAKRTAVVLLMVGFVIGITAAVSQVWTRLEVIDYGYKLSKVNREHTRLLEVNRRLKIEYALLKNPTYINRVARERLGMKTPVPEQVRRLRRIKGPTRKRVAARGAGRRP